MPHQDNPITRISQLSPEKQALLREWKRGKITIDTRRLAIPRRSLEEGIPLSFAQQRLWFIDQLVPGIPAYNATLTIRLTGPLRPLALEQSLNEIIRRHEALRTTFPALDGTPSQVILPHFVLPLTRTDLRSYPVTEREQMAESITLQEDRQPFDLAHGPLIRARLLLLDEEDHTLLVMMHHMVCDGLSIAVFVQELEELYGAYAHGHPSPLPELPIQYADFTLWERQRVQTEQEVQRAYWKEQLEGASTFLNLPTDRPYPAVRSFHGALHKFTLPQQLTEALKTFSKQEGVTPFTVLLATFQLLLARYSGQQDIIVGMPIANRPRVETEKLIGFFASTLVLRTQLHFEQGFRSLISQVRETLLDATKNQDCPFEQIVDELHLERTMSHNPLFQVMFNFGNLPLPKMEQAGLQLSLKYARSDSSMFDLWLAMGEKEHALNGVLEYNTDIYDAETTAHLIGHFQQLLASALAAPDAPIAQLALITKDERQMVVREWNATYRPYQLDVCLHQLVERQVERTPQALALVFERETMTYTQLNQAANQLAHYLREQGVGVESIVSICLERCFDMVIGLLAILKAGGAYLPLDPTLPAERVAFMQKQAGSSFVLTHQRFLTLLSQEAISNIVLDTDKAYWSRYPTSNPDYLNSPDDLAYVIYTSGSTGQPKGVAIPHRGICNRLLWMQETYQLTADDRVLQKTPFSFDVSVWEFFWPLQTGASLVIAQPEGHKDCGYLIDLIAAQHITTIHFVPPMLRVFLEEKDLQRCSSLKRVICSGEALPFDVQQRFFQLMSAELHNLYGPTEASVDVTFWHCQRESQHTTVPIGRPIANTQIYLLDPYFEPVPIGIPGELYIGGIGLAKGYLNRPDLTAEQFIADPFSQEADARLYRTGDLARYRLDGSIDFLGRLDTQVKLRGFRIELSEIEAVLRQHSSIHEAVVVAREDISGEKRLAAYIVPTSQQEIAGDSRLPAEQVERWQQVFDETYQETSAQTEATFNIAGWNSSYTGLPLSIEEMQEWVETTVESILNLHPDQVLEIGCGTGLLLFRIAPHCTSYTGTDLSQVGLDSIARQLSQQGLDPSKVTLLQCTADDFAPLAAREFDTIILNSVIQYFPDIDYLLNVLSQASSLLKPGGKIFIGDVRSLPLLETFHTAVECFNPASASLTLEQLELRIRERIVQEKELIIDPRFFLALQHWLSDVSSVQIQLKRGRFHNELTQFRYDVSIQVKAEEQTTQEPLTLDWRQSEFTLPALKQYLQREAPVQICITGVPNARLVSAMQLQELLAAENDRQKTLSDLQASAPEPEQGIDPAEIWAIKDEFPYDVDLRGTEQSKDGSFEAIFSQRVATCPRLFVQATEEPQPLHSYANEPLKSALTEQLITTLRNYMKEKLPEYMIPAFFTVLDALPLNTNGKVDRQALPAATLSRSVFKNTFVAPRTPDEIALAAIWTSVLNIAEIGCHDNFFDLGGDSISSIQIVSRARQAGFQLTPKMLFQQQTLAELAAVLGSVQLLSEPEPVDEYTAPLTPEQRHLLAQKPDSLYALSHLLLKSSCELDVVLIRQAIQHIVRQHKALHMQLEHGTAGSVLRVIPLSPERLSSEIELSSGQTIEQAVIQRLDQAAHDNRDTAHTPPFHATIFTRPAEQTEYLLFTASPLLIDGTSWDILLASLETAYRQLTHGASVQLPPEVTTFDQWSALLTKQKPLQAAQQELPDERLTQSTASPGKIRDSRSPNEDSGTVSMHLSTEETQTLCRDSLQAYHTRVHELLLAALAHTIAQWTGRPLIHVDLIKDGRTDELADTRTTETIGYFSRTIPVTLDLVAAQTTQQIIQTTKEQLRTVLRQGKSAEGAPHSADRLEQTASGQPVSPVELQLYYKEPYGQDETTPIFEVLESSAQPSFLQTGSDLPSIGLIAHIYRGQLHLHWVYNECGYQRATIEHIAHLYYQALNVITTHCQSPLAGGYTPSDFPLARINQQQLDELSHSYGPIEDLYPLTPMQQNVVFQRRHTHNPELYWLCSAVRWQNAQIQIPAFEQAWRQTIQQHPTLRSSIVWEGLNEPLQLVQPEAHLEIEHYDWRGMTDVEHEKAITLHIQKMRKRGSQLAHAPHMHLSLFRLTDQHYYISRCFNYMLQDGWSSTLIARDFDAFYEAACLNSPCTIEPARPFRDLIHWLQQQDQQKAEQHWKKMLHNACIPTPLLERAPRPVLEQETIPAAYHKPGITLSFAMTTALQSLARKHHLTMGTLLYSAWSLILSRYSGKDDIIFGSVCSGRPPSLARSEYVVGMFNNILPLRIQIPGDISMLAFLKSVRMQIVELQEYEYSSLLQIKRWINMPETARLFESYLVFEDFPMYSYQNVGQKKNQDFGTMVVDPQRSFVPTEHPLRVEFWPLQTFTIRLSCYQHYMSMETLQQFLTQFQVVLESMLNQPTQQVRDILAQIKINNEC